MGTTIAPACGNTADDDIYLCVVNLPALGIDTRSGGFHELKAYAHRHSALPVTRILLRDIGLRKLLSYMTAGIFTSGEEVSTTPHSTSSRRSATTSEDTDRVPPAAV